MPLAVAVYLTPAKFMCIARTVIMGNGDRYRVVTAVALSTRTMKPANGLTGKGKVITCCLFYGYFYIAL